MPPDLARRAFLRGRTTIETPLRPPWALDEAAFLGACTGCNDCINACPENVLARGEGGYPVFDPALGECTFCGACATACVPHALDPVGATQPWNYKAHIASTCLALNGVICLGCRDACGEAAIRFRPAVGVSPPQLDLNRCTGCGACVDVCPVSAITIATVQLPEPAHGR